MLLSRVAESLYWINRYLERAENISRFVEVSEAMSLDCPPGSAEPWLPLIEASSDRESFDKRFPEKKPDDVINFLIRDRLNPNSIISCIQMARENARQIRDVMTTEMWEQINILYWNMQEGEVIWNKPNPMPESVRDRCTKSHEYIFLLSKSKNYYFDVDAIKESTIDGKGLKRKRSVWTVNTKPYKAAHFAVYPPELIEPCIKAGSQKGDIILDPFMGSGTTGMVAKSLGRYYIGCELNENYGKLIQNRVSEYTINLEDFV